MPKVGARASTPETPRINRDTLRRAVLYNSNPTGSFLKPKLTKSQDDDAMSRSKTISKNDPISKPMAQQITESNRGFVKTAPGHISQKGWNVGYSNKTSVYSTEPQNLLRYGYSGAKQLQRKRLDKRIVVTEWTPKLEGKPSLSAAPNPQTTPGLWPSEGCHNGSGARDSTIDMSSNSKVQLEALARLSRTIDRERDAEARFDLQVAVDKKRNNTRNNRSETNVLSQGLGPEAKLKVLRRAESSIIQSNKNMSATSRNGGKKSSKQSQNNNTTGRIVIPKTERLRPRYCGGLTVCVDSKSGNDFNVGDMARAAESKEIQSTQQQWQLIGRFHAKWFQSDPNKHQFSYSSLKTALTGVAASNPDAMRISREQFISTTMMRLRDMNLAHRLYASLGSQLDQDSHDSVPILDILLPLVMLASAQAGKPQSEVLLTALQLYESTSPPLTFSNVMTVFQASASTRLEKLELISRASSGFDFALRAAAAAAEMAQSVGAGGSTHSGKRRGRGLERGSEESTRMNSRELMQTQAYDLVSFDESETTGDGNQTFETYGNIDNENYTKDNELLNVGGGGVVTGLTPELVLDVLLEFPDLASDINKQMEARFLAAGRAVASLAVLESSEIQKKQAEKQSRDAQVRKVNTPKHGRDSRLNSKPVTPDTGNRNMQEWVEVGIKAGDARKTSFMLPSYDDSDVDSDEEETRGVVRGV